MVLFNETEAMLLLDLYLHYRSNSQNLTSGGVLLKMHARDELTRAMNRYFKREAPWTESQVTVKFKNLRSEFIELKWLAEQPGFHVEGKGISEDWWAEIKARRPKVHAFKGKLPWPFYKKMAVIVGDLPPSTNLIDIRTAQRISQLLSEVSSEPSVHGGARSSGAGNPMHHGNGTFSSNGGEAAGQRLPMTYQQQTHQPAIQPSQLSSKRPRESSSKRPRKRISDMTDEERERQQSLAKSVEHGSRVAADIAKGFNNLVVMYEQQAGKCAEIEAGDDSFDLQNERQILASLASSLEKSSQATADMAKGFRDLISLLIQDTEDAGSALI